MEKVTWSSVNNTVSDRMSNDSVTLALQVTSKIKKRTKLVNHELRKFCGLKNYKHYLEIKRSYLKKASIDEESDYECGSGTKIANASRSNFDPVSYSSAEESEGDLEYEDILIGRNPSISLSDSEDENCTRRNESNKSRTENRASESRTSRSASIRNQSTSFRKSVQSSTSRKSTLRKSKKVQTKLTDFLGRKSISDPEETSSQEDEELQMDEKEISGTIESPPKTRASPQKISKAQPESSKKTSVQQRVTESRKLQNKTPEDVKKNLSAIIGDSETENLTKKNSDKYKLNQTQDSDLNLSNLMAVAQSTQYPDDSSDISDKTEKRSLVSDFMTNKNKNHPKDSGIEEDSTEESAILKGKCKKVIDNNKSTSKQKYAKKSVSNNINDIHNSSNNDKTLCYKAEDASEEDSLKEGETLKNYENEFNVPYKEKHPPKIIGSEIVNKKYKILSKEQEDSTEISEEEEEVDVVGMENCDESESFTCKLKESKKEDESEKEALTVRVEDEIEESNEGLEKIKKFIIKKPNDKKLFNQEATPGKEEKSEKRNIRELEMSEESCEEKSDNEIKKKVKERKQVKESIEEKNRKDREKMIFSSSESEFEKQEEEKESPKKQSKERKLTLEGKDDSVNGEGPENEKQQEKRKQLHRDKNKIEKRKKIDEKYSTEEESKEIKKKVNERKKEKERIKEKNINEKNRKGHEKIIFSSSESEFEEQEEEKESPKKQLKERKLTLEGEDDSVSEEGPENEKQQEKRKQLQRDINKIEERKKVDEKSSNEEESKEIKKMSNERKKEKENLKEKNIFSCSDSEFEEQEEEKESPKKQSKERKWILEEKDDSINEEGSANEKQQGKRKQLQRDKIKKKIEKSSSEEESEGEKEEVKRKESQQEKNKIEERRQVEDKSSSEEESEGEKEEVKQKEIQQEKTKVEEKVKEYSSGHKSEDEKEIKQTKIQKHKDKSERRKFKEQKDDSRNIEEEKENEDPKLKLGVENNDKEDETREAEEKKDEREEHEDQEREESIFEDEKVISKIVEKPVNENENSELSSPEKIETANEDSSEEETNSRQIFTQFVDRKHDSDSEEEKQDEEEMRLTLEGEENYINLDDNKITIEEHKIEISENVNTATSNEEEGEDKMSAASVRKVQQMKRLDLNDSSSSDEEFSPDQLNKIKKFVRKEKSDSSGSDSEEDVKEKSPKKKDSPKKKSNKKKSPDEKENLKETSPKKKEKSPKKKKLPEDLVKSSDESEGDSKEDEKEETKEVVQPVDEDRAFENYIQDGISSFQQKKYEEALSNNQAKEGSETQNLESSQIISDPDTQVSLHNEKTKPKENRKKELEAECLNYVLLNLKDKNKRNDKGIEHQTVVDETQELNKNEDAADENFQKMTELEELVEKHNLIEHNLPTTMNLDDISDNEEVWMIQIPKKDISTHLRGKKMSYNGSKLKLGEKAYKTSEKKLKTLVCVYNSQGSKRPYKTFNLRPVGSVIVRPKNAFDTSSVKNGLGKKKRKRSDVQDSSVNISKEVIHPQSDIQKKLKKKKQLFSQESVLEFEDEKTEDKKLESSQGPESANTVQERKRKHFSSESEEEEKVEPKVDIKRKKIWNTDEYALDEKPPVFSTENLSAKKQKIYKRINNESDSSSVGLWEEKKPKKEKLKKEKELKPETSSLEIEKVKKVITNLIAESSVKKQKKCHSLNVSKVKIKNDKEQIESDSSTINKVKNEKNKKKKKRVENWNVESVLELEQKEEKLPSEIAIKPEKKKKKFRRDSEKLNDLSTGNKTNKTKVDENSEDIKLSKIDRKSKKEILDEQDFSSDFEVKGKTESKKKRGKKLKKNSIFEETVSWDDLDNQMEVEPKKEKSTKKVDTLINFEH